MLSQKKNAYLKIIYKSEQYLFPVFRFLPKRLCCVLHADPLPLSLKGIYRQISSFRMSQFMCISSSRKTQIQNMEISQGSICAHAWGDSITLSLMTPGFLRSWPDSSRSVHLHGFISLLYQCYPNSSHQSSPLAGIPVQPHCTVFSWASGQPQLVKAPIRSWPCFMHIISPSPLSKPWIPSPNIQGRIWPNFIQLPSRHSPHLFGCAYSCLSYLLLDNFMLSHSSISPSLQDSIPHLMSPRTAFIFSVIWRFAFPGGRMLRLMQTRPEDAGQYTCIVRNAAGEERKMFGLSVLGTCGLCSI